MYEIELKAKLSDRQKVEEKIATFAEFEGVTEKSDVYWTQNRLGHPEKIRLREETGKPLTVTYKRKEIRQKQIEVNDEIEFTIGCVEDSEKTAKEKGAFEFFLNAAGFSPTIHKHKETKSWKFENALLEISYVDKLGDYIEIEILSDTDTPETTGKAHAKLLSILEKCNVPESDIETRYYSEMLQGK